jgi:NADH dehydrogenase
MLQKKKRIVIVGAGFGGVYAMKTLHKQFHKDPSVELVLVNKTNYFLFTPLLHEAATGSIRPDNIAEPLRKVFHCCAPTLIVDTVTDISFSKKEIVFQEHAPLSYDYLVLATGAHTHFFGTPGADEYAFTLKTIEDANKLRHHCIALLDKASCIQDPKKRQELLHTVIIGGGPTGVELAAELAELLFESLGKHYPQAVMNDVKITLVQRGDALLPMFDTRMQRAAQRILEKKGIHVALNSPVEKIEKNAVILANNKTLQTQTPIWVAGIEANMVAFDDPPKENNKKCLVVNEYLQLPAHKEVFAIGDAAFCEPHPMPALGQVAEMQGKLAAKNIHAHITGKPLTQASFKLKGTLVSLGQWYAIGKIGPLFIQGRITWWIWRTIYASKLLSWKKRIQVILDWTVHIFSARNISNV